MKNLLYLAASQEPICHLWNFYWFPLQTPSLFSFSTDYKVSISGTRIELTCPLDSDTIKWEKNDKELSGESDKQLMLSDFSEVEDSGYYACYTDATKKNAYLYLKARGNSGSSPNSFLENPPGQPPSLSSQSSSCTQSLAPWDHRVPAFSEKQIKQWPGIVWVTSVGTRRKIASSPRGRLGSLALWHTQNQDWAASEIHFIRRTCRETQCHYLKV